jgi:hypothetical protein
VPPAAKAKAAPVTGTPVAPETTSVAKPAAMPAAKAKARRATASAAKPKSADAPVRAARATRARPSPAAVPSTPEQLIATRPATAIVEAPAIEVVRVVTDDDIRVRAYFLSIEHRARGGSDIDFWLIAERELRHGIKAKD